jgi:hypothetical protein
MRRVVVLALCVAIAAVAWHYRGEIRVAWEGLVGGAADVPSEELAAGAQAKLEAFAGREAPARVVLTEPEVQSLVRFRLAGLLPPYVVAPQVELDDGRVRIRAQLPTEQFPRVDELSEAMGFLPDTAEVHAVGQLIPIEGGGVGLAVDEISAAKIPLPRGFIPTVLRRLGRRDAPGLPPDAVALPLPEGVSTAYIRGDSLILIGRSVSRN